MKNSSKKSKAGLVEIGIHSALFVTVSCVAIYAFTSFFSTPSPVLDGLAGGDTLLQ
ncbi:MAG: hypothetical protein OXE92_00140 [Bacteroidetes bacterium]|nr:hypothetical protein [Bacteroidota bacterium]